MSSQKKKKQNRRIKKPVAKKNKASFNFKMTPSLRFLRNIFIAIIVLFIAFFSTREGNLYGWTYKNLLVENIKFALGKYGELDVHQKYVVKMKDNYQYIKLVKDNTPEDAIILFPDRKHFNTERSTMKLSNQLSHPGYISFFLYPRKVIYDNRESIYKDKYTHVAILDYWGYDKLNYKIDSPVEYTILPVNR